MDSRRFCETKPTSAALSGEPREVDLHGHRLRDVTPCGAGCSVRTFYEAAPIKSLSACVSGQSCPIYSGRHCGFEDSTSRRPSPIGGSSNVAGQEQNRLCSTFGGTGSSPRRLPRSVRNPVV